MGQEKFNTENLIIDPALADYSILPGKNSNIEYIGQNQQGMAFIQFHSGSTYLYNVGDIKDFTIEKFSDNGFRRIKAMATYFRRLITRKEE